MYSMGHNLARAGRVDDFGAGAPVPYAQDQSNLIDFTVSSSKSQLMLSPLMAEAIKTVN